jgi:hypothetical protein
MGSLRGIACFVALSACLVTAGCGSSGSGSTTTPVKPSRALHEPIQDRGIKGEDPAAEAASRLHLSVADCDALARLAEERLGKRLTEHPSPKPPLSRCRLEGHGASISVFLDTGFAANQRYHNRIDETVQFNGENPDGLPQPVPGVGEKAAYNSAANWIPALRSLLAVRGNRWLTVTISVMGRSDEQLLAEAAILARAGFKLTADG